MVVSLVETNPQDFEDWSSLHRLLVASFAELAPRIDPPSSMDRLTVDGLRAKAAEEDLFLVRHQGAPVACVFGARTRGGYYIGKLASAPQHRRKGLARALVRAAGHRAHQLGAPYLELQSRVELLENHTLFRSLGFDEVGATTHPGYDRPTSLTFRRALPFP